MRWYVEPAFADQRAFNDAVLKLIDDLDERVARLEQPSNEDRRLPAAGAVRARRRRADGRRPRRASCARAATRRRSSAIPFKWYPGTRVLDQAFLWRLVDLTEADGRPIDRVIATKFPAYCVRHPNKVAWVLHQFRQAYDYDRTELGQFSESPEDRATRARGRAARPRRARRGAQGVRDLANVAERLRALQRRSTRSCCRIRRRRSPYRRPSRSGYVLSVNRLDRAKRIDLLIEAAKREPSLRVVIAGEGPDRERLERLAAGLNGQVDVRRPRRRRASSPISTPAASPSTTRRSTRTSGWSRTRRSCRRSRS